MTSTRTVLPAATGALVGLLALCTPRDAGGQRLPEAEPAQTFEYRTPAPRNYLRGVLELQSFYAFGLLWYMTDVLGKWDPGYRWDVFERKLTTGRLHQDTNGFGTNFRGHATGGTGYYIAARSNRLSVSESFGLAVLGAVAWEYFGEVGEQVSLNDVIYTPLSGTAIAEPFTQLASYFDRASPTPVNRALGTLFGPLKTLNDQLDGLTLARASSGHPEREWHEFPFELGIANVFEGGSLPAATHAGELRFGVSERLARLPGYDGAAERDYWFGDAQLSGIAVRAAFASHGLSDFAFEPHAVMAGHYSRFARGRGSALRGGGYATGLRVGLTYQVHDYRRAQAGQRDFSAFVEPLGGFFESRLAHGSARLRLTLDAGAEYGGVHPIAMSQYRGSLAGVTPELRVFSYYFALGGRVRSEAELALGAWRVDAGMVSWAFGSVDEHTSLPISDGYSRFAAGIGYWPSATTTLRVFAERAQRFGRMGAAREDARELNFGAAGVARF